MHGGKPLPPVAETLPSCVRASPLGGSTLTVRAKPGSRVAAVVALGAALEVAINAPAREGEANQALTEFVASVLRVRKRDVVLQAGSKSRDKVLHFSELAPPEVVERLRGALP